MSCPKCGNAAVNYSCPLSCPKCRHTWGGIEIREAPVPAATSTVTWFSTNAPPMLSGTYLVAAKAASGFGRATGEAEWSRYNEAWTRDGRPLPNTPTHWAVMPEAP